MICPRCGAALIERGEGLFEDIFLYQCASCEGALYLVGSLDRLDDSVTIEVEDLDWEVIAASELACPLCRQEGYRGGSAVMLDRVRVAVRPEVELARCPSCDCFWLDRGQLDEVRELATRVSSAENASLNEEARRKREREIVKGRRKRGPGEH